MVSNSSLLKLRSSQKASSNSWTLRLRLRSEVRKTFLAICWVSVLPPWTSLPARKLTYTARAKPTGSRPK